MALPGTITKTLVYTPTSWASYYNVLLRANAVIEREIGGTTYQFIPSWNGNNYLQLSVRTIGGSWQHTIFSSIVAISDPHFVVNCGIDENNYLHLAYNMHSNALKYRRSQQPLNTFDGTLTNNLSMLGTNESEVTYPYFFNDPAGKLYIVFRDGTAGDGDIYMYQYNAATETWSAMTGTIAGLLIQGKPDDISPYIWMQPAFDANYGSGGYIHVAWSWRDEAMGGAETNHDPSYMRFDGANWTQSDGTAQTIPATLANSEIVESVPAGMASTNFIDSDSNGHPHLAYIKPDGSDQQQVWHCYHNGTNWIILQLSDTTGVWQGTAANNLSNVAIFIDRRSDTAYVMYADRTEDNGPVVVWISDPGDFTTWRKETFSNDGSVTLGWRANINMSYWHQVHKIQMPWSDAPV